MLSNDKELEDNCKMLAALNNDEQEASKPEEGKNEEEESFDPKPLGTAQLTAMLALNDQKEALR